MILDPEGAKLSKRTGAADVMQYKDAGYLPHALINYLARLGWSHGDQELFTREELIKLFSVEDVNSKAARLDMDKLGWVNQHYLKSDEPATIVPQLEYQLRKLGLDPSHGPAPSDVVVALRDRVHTLKEMAERAAVWYQPLEIYDEAAVAKHLNPAAAAPLNAARDHLANAVEWTLESVSAALHDTAAALGLGMGKVAQPLRVAITGTQVSPDISQTVYLAGREQVLKRIDAALIKIPADA
jgi:glutamyl-tRNA synthetase